MLCWTCQWSWKSMDERAEEDMSVHIDRYDRVLDEYVSLGSYTAMHRMNTEYPTQTKLLIENVLELGSVDEPDIERRLRYFYLDSTVHVLLDEVHRQYGDMSDIEEHLTIEFRKLRAKHPDMRVPHVYTQISCLNQSIVVGDTLIGISLDKYLGEDFPVYKKYYSPEQRSQMTRSAIVKDAVSAKTDAHT